MGSLLEKPHLGRIQRPGARRNSYGTSFSIKRRKRRRSLPLIRLSIHQPLAFAGGQQRGGPVR